MNRHLSRGLLALAVVAAATAGIAGASTGSEPQRTARGALTCEAHRIPAGQHHLYGELCFRGKPRPDTPVQVLLHGGAYDHRYWDWPYRPRTYSYVEQATQRGFATLNLDRLGYGFSDHPDPAALDFAAGGKAVHQVVRHLRAGRFGVPFQTVVLNGHSMGGIVAEHAAARGGVDAVVVSGIPKDPQPGERDDAGSDGPDDPLYPFTPAENDPRFAGQPWADGYYTTAPGSRMPTFHYPGTTEPATTRGEESAKSTLSSGELCALRPCGGRTARSPEPESQVPTLYVLGRHDMLFCRQTQDCATDPGSGGTENLIPRAGHSINLSKGAPAFYRLTFRWLARQGIR